MNHKEFFVWLEEYYGKYPRPGLRRAVGEYILTIPEYNLDKLSNYLIRAFSTQYNFTPDVATLEVARKDIRPDPDEIKPYRPALPEPGARDMKVEVGQLMEIVLMKVARNKKARGEI